MCKKEKVPGTKKRIRALKKTFRIMHSAVARAEEELKKAFPNKAIKVTYKYEH